VQQRVGSYGPHELRCLFVTHVEDKPIEALGFTPWRPMAPGSTSPPGAVAHCRGQPHLACAKSLLRQLGGACGANVISRDLNAAFFQGLEAGEACSTAFAAAGLRRRSRMPRRVGVRLTTDG
jgi:hypothetical protein